MSAQPPVSAGPAPALTLLVLAAGLGERYGGLKQLEPVGPDGETVIDYAVRHAMQAGFSRVIFVIRVEFAAVFKAQIGSKYEAILSVGYALQDVDDLPKGHTPPRGAASRGALPMLFGRPAPCWMAHLPLSMATIFMATRPTKRWPSFY